MTSIRTSEQAHSSKNLEFQMCSWFGLLSQLFKALTGLAVMIYPLCGPPYSPCAQPSMVDCLSGLPCDPLCDSRLERLVTSCDDVLLKSNHHASNAFLLLVL